jgi:putative endopeptidase
VRGRPSRATVPLAALVVACAAALSAAANDKPDVCQDLDTYVNGEWLARTELPPERARVGSFDELRIANDRLLEKALAELVAEPARQTSPGLKLLARLYASGMDEAAIEKRGLTALQPWLARIDRLDRAALPALLGEFARSQFAAPVTLWVATDAKDSNRHALYAGQGGLGLPDRDDYTRSDDEATRRVTAAYRVYAARLLQAAGVQGADAATIDALMAFESRLAAAALTRIERRDPRAQYNPKTLDELKALAPGFDWAAWIAAYGVAPESLAARPLVVSQPRFVQAVAAAAQDTPIETWRHYLRVRLLDATAEYGPRALRQARFDYRDGAIRGLKAPLRRSDSVMLAIGGRSGGEPLGQTLGELYAAKAFSPLAQQRALVMVADIREAMRRRIGRLAWMNDSTKAEARAKLDAMVAKIGLPAKWRDYGGLVLDADGWLANHLRITAWATADRIGDLGRPVDRERWTTSPHIVNAFAASGNTIVFPAGILQPPFFDPNADDASNYGGIGMVIGHEIIHHFDDRGRQFDRVGALRDWWTAEDAAAYKARADRAAALYDSFEPVPGVRINGRQTLGENISDIGGVQIAFEGLQIALERQRAAGKPAARIEGRTPEQRYFINLARIWRSKQRTEALVDQLRTGQHSPGRWRVLAPAAQMTAFAEAFGCKAGDGMVAKDPIVIW